MHPSRIPLFFTVFAAIQLLLHPLPAQVPSRDAQLSDTITTNKWDREIQAFLDRDRTNSPAKGAVLFTGSSSIRMWKGLETSFTGIPVIARGFGGSKMSDLIHHTPRIVLPYEPAHVLIYEGDNDLAAGISPETILAEFKEFTTIVHSRLPSTRISFIAIKPSIARARLLESIRKTNQLIEEHCRSNPLLGYVDVFNPMMQDTSQVRTNLFVKDGLHLNPAGYEIWKGVISNHLAGSRIPR